MNSSLIHDAFTKLVAVEPAATALIDGVSTALTSRQELLEQSRTISERLRSESVGPGHIVAVQLPNSVEFVATLLALLGLRAVALPVDRDGSDVELAKLARHFAVRAIVKRGSAPGTVAITSGCNGDAQAIEPGVALLKLTSGSTGLPKAVLTTEANLMADCRNICSSMGITPADLNLGAIPFSHSYGFSNLVSPLLLQGTALLFSNDYVPISLLELANRHRCTVVPGIPMMFDLLSQTLLSDGQFDTVRTFISAGAPLSAVVSRRFRERFGSEIHSFYGCSECGGITYDRSGGAVERHEVGPALDGVTLSVEKETGRMTVESDAVALGYVGAPAGEPARFTPGRFVTEDVARIEKDGSVQLVGRIGDFINTAGRKVNPREVEGVLLELEGVREVKVYGEPAGSRGEVVAAVVAADPSVSREQLRAHCRQWLSPHKVPRIIKLIDAMPVDERGKVKKSLLASISSDR